MHTHTHTDAPNPTRAVPGQTQAVQQWEEGTASYVLGKKRKKSVRWSIKWRGIRHKVLFFFLSFCKRKARAIHFFCFFFLRLFCFLFVSPMVVTSVCLSLGSDRVSQDPNPNYAKYFFLVITKKTTSYIYTQGNISSVWQWLCACV